MMTNRSRTVLYTGVTNSLERRVWFHRNHTVKSFTKTYKVDRLVYYEQFNEALHAIAREKEIKGWRREKKNELVQTLNPKWRDLGLELFGSGSGKVTRREQCE
jgi:putative endonuclease